MSELVEIVAAELAKQDGFNPKAPGSGNYMPHYMLLGERIVNVIAEWRASFGDGK